jgi:small subunit ribosomal protein S10e
VHSVAFTNSSLSSSLKRTALRYTHISLKVGYWLIKLNVFNIFILEGTLVAKKDFYADKHSDALPIPNLEVLCLLRSFKSKGFVTETFNWQYYYYFLTNEGIEYLRQYLALPAEIVPATLRKAASKADKQSDEKGKSSGPGADFNPEFQKEKVRN